MYNDLHAIKEALREESEKASSLQDIEDIRVKYLGKKGLLTAQLKYLGSIPKEQRPEFGSLLNETKKYIEALLDEAGRDIQVCGTEQIASNPAD